jgi:tetratricopeptide (TPR) repeat protein
MAIAYNNGISGVIRAKTGAKLAIVSVCGALVFAGISCRKATTATYDRVAVRPTAESITEADKLYAGRDDLVKVRQAIVALRQAQADDPANYDLAWRLAKFNYYLGAHSPNSTEQDKSFHEGIDAAKLAVKLQDGKPEGHFWLGANYGGSAQISVLAGLSEIEDIKREMETVIKIDEGFQSGSAYMVLGQLYMQSPRVLGGDTQKAIENLEKGLKFGPSNALLRVRLAQAYAQDHRNADAQKQIDALFAMKPSPDYEPEYNEAVAEAKKLQEKMKKLLRFATADFLQFFERAFMLFKFLAGLTQFAF